MVSTSPVCVIPAAVPGLHHAGRVRLPDVGMAAVTFQVVVDSPVPSFP